MSKLLLAAGMALICGTAAWGKNNVPDFRYPETVINDATKQIEKADKKGNHKALVDGLVRLSIAKSQISADYMPELINHVDSFAARVSDVRAKSLLLGLESDIVVATYQHESYKYNSRQKAGDVRPSDPREWCREDYEDRIIELTDSMLCHRTELLATPVKDYESILEMPNVCPEFVPSLYDMLAHHCIAKINDLADSYPNGNENSAARQCVAGIYASLLSLKPIFSTLPTNTRTLPIPWRFWTIWSTWIQAPGRWLLRARLLLATAIIRASTRCAIF